MPLSSTTPTIVELAQYMTDQGITQDVMQSAVKDAVRSQQLAMVTTTFVTSSPTILSDQDWGTVKAALAFAPISTDIQGLVKDIAAAATVNDQHKFIAATLMVLQILYSNYAIPKTPLGA